MPLIFLYSYNTPILLTNKIIVKKLNNFLKIQKKRANKYIKKKIGINKYSPIDFLFFLLASLLQLFIIIFVKKIRVL